MPKSLVDYYIGLKTVLAKKPSIANVMKSFGGLLVGMQLIIPATNPINMALNVNKYFDTYASAQTQDADQFPNTFPESKLVPLRTMKIPVTAYNSLPGQTDSTPCHTANNYNLCEANEENVIAANFLKLGTKVRFPDLYGDRIFTVQDRMNARYSYRADIWLRSHPEAIKFGLKYTTIEIF